LVSPQGVYAASKLAGEERVAAANPHHLILRTAWVYSPFRTNFVKTMLRLAEDRDEIAVVADQWGNPTSAFDLADAILVSSAVLHGDRSFARFGVYHLVGTGDTNRSGFAHHILATSRALDGPYAAVKEISTRDYPTKALRPRNSRLSTAEFEATFNWTAPDWHRSTVDVVSRLLIAEMKCAPTL